MSNESALCELCGEPMPPGETMFKYHGLSGNCPKPPLSREPKSTYEQLEKDLAEAKAEIERLNAQLYEFHRFPHRLRETEQRALIEKLVEALNKIADPRKRDHKEPDKYTEVGCMINMADEALALHEAWKKEQEG